MDFEEIMDTFQYNSVSKNAVYLRAFPFTLKDYAKHGLRSLPQGSIRTWEEMTSNYLDKYFSSDKMGKFRREIHNFCQNEIKTVFEAYESFKEIVRKCQHRGIELWMQLQDFWDGLTPTSRKTLSNAAGGSSMKKTPVEIVTILDELSEDANQWPSEIAKRRRSTGVHHVDANTSMQVQLDSMAKEIRNLTLASIHNEPHAACDICGRGYPTYECQASMEEVNAKGNYNFNSMGQKYPDFSCSSPGGTTNSWQQNNSIFQGALGFCESAQAAVSASTANSVLVRRSNEILHCLRNLDRQVGQIANVLSERILGTLPVDIKKNLKEMVNNVTLISGQVLKDPTPIQKEVALKKESEKEMKIEDDDKNTKKKKGKKGVEKKKKDETSRKEESEDVSKHMPALPFPQKLYREKLDKASINLMPLSIYRKLEKEIREIRSVPISLQLADQTTIIPEEIVEDVLVRVDKFVFPVDFIVLNMDENKVVPLILGTPFLETGRAILDIHDRKHLLRLGEETVTFEMNVANGVKKEKPTASVEWKVKGVKEKAIVSEKYKCGVYPQEG
ncbi:uncharacterized protein [Nicotiana sylvestris]|uniref:uncharacterized protein n=1 Tax=Nicotiana sylvestris TaxID=4096 RepID=UPI00388C5210